MLGFNEDNSSINLCQKMALHKLADPISEIHTVMLSLIIVPGPTALDLVIEVINP